MKKYLKKIAKKILKDELKDLDSQITSLKDALNGKGTSFISASMMKAILNMLPDPNRAGNLLVSEFDLKIRSRMIPEDIAGKCRVLTLDFVPAKGRAVCEIYKEALIRISEYDIVVKIPLVLESNEEKIFGVKVDIRTYVWNLRGIRVLTDEAWQVYSEASFAMKQSAELFK